MSYFFSFSGYQTKRAIEFLFRELMTSWTLRFIFDHVEKEGRTEIQKNWISREQKEHFRWNKKHFSVSEGLSFGEKSKIWWKQRTQDLT